MNALQQVERGEAPALPENLAASDITKLALQQNDALCLQAVDAFLTAFGAECRAVALRHAILPISCLNIRVSSNSTDLSRRFTFSCF
jgi:hypothetical protein